MGNKYVFSENDIVKLVDAAISVSRYEDSLVILGMGKFDVPDGLEALWEIHGLVRRALGFPEADDTCDTEKSDALFNTCHETYHKIINKYKAEKCDLFKRKEIAARCQNELKEAAADLRKRENSIS